MSRKKCVLVNCFASSNEMRIEPVREVFDQLGYETIYLASDFHHTKKKHIDLTSEITTIHVSGYSKNISFSRIHSHYQFSKKVYRFLCNERPDVIYIKIPPNSLVKFLNRYKNQYNCKIIIDVFDLWPESLPINNVICSLISPLTSMWKRMRNDYIHCGDLIISECDMYKELLYGVIPENSRTVYLTKKDIEYEFVSNDNYKLIKLCYLGGINNLIDIEQIGEIIEELSKKTKVEMDIIGDGINRDELILKAESKGCKVTYHGVIYDEAKKYSIMKHCDFGINIMKKTSKVALTLKSIEYLRAGLALINNIPYDTQKIIDCENCGINLDRISELDVGSIPLLRINARRTYEKYFSYDNCKLNISKALETISIK